MSQPTYRQPFQHAWRVADIEAAAERFSATLGIGPFFVAEYRGKVFEEVLHFGQSTELHLKTAIAYSGDTQVELVEPQGSAPSIYTLTNDLPAGRYHHTCYWSDDIDADIDHYAANGCAAVDVGKMRGGPRFAYLDARETLGSVIELLEFDEGIATLFDSWKRKNQAWDGETPFIRL
ncbi:MAG: VOC family protein [Pseudomonadota bacterium]